MRIEELIPEQSITFLVLIGNQQLEFSTKVLESIPNKRMILAAPIIKDNKIITFRVKGILIHLIVQYPDQKPLVFQNVTVRTARRKDESLCYTITTLAESKEFNRRGAYRCIIGVDTHIRIGSNRSAIEAIIKDISATGFSFTISGENNYQDRDRVHAVVNDYIEETAENYSFHLFGSIVRNYSLENGNIVYGCELTQKVVGLERYLMEKERIRLQNSRGNKKLPNKKKKN